VDQGKRAIGRTIEVTVTSVLQTTAGKMIFCRWPEAWSEEPSSRRESRSSRNDRDRGSREERTASVSKGEGRSTGSPGREEELAADGDSSTKAS
jgi:hypothetical protein